MATSSKTGSKRAVPKKPASRSNGRVRRPEVTMGEGRQTFFQLEPAEVLLSGGLEGTILDGARRCLLRFGSKMTVGDVAAAANVSRGSVYKYYLNREQLVDAVSDLCFRLFVDDMDRAMSQRETLADQIAAAAVEVREWNRAGESVRQGGLVSEDELGRVLRRNGTGPLQREAAVARRYLELAQARGEIRRDIDLDQAAEWTVRITHSFTTNPALSFDEDDPRAIEDFVSGFIVRGFL